MIFARQPITMESSRKTTSMAVLGQSHFIRSSTSSHIHSNKLATGKRLESLIRSPAKSCGERLLKRRCGTRNGRSLRLSFSQSTSLSSIRLRGLLWTPRSSWLKQKLVSSFLKWTRNTLSRALAMKKTGKPSRSFLVSEYF